MLPCYLECVSWLTVDVYLERLHAFVVGVTREPRPVLLPVKDKYMLENHMTRKTKCSHYKRYRDYINNILKKLSS